MTRRTRHDPGIGFGRKLLILLAAAALIYWAGRDPHAAAAIARAIGTAIAHLAHGLSHARPSR